MGCVVSNASLTINTDRMMHESIRVDLHWIFDCIWMKLIFNDPKLIHWRIVVVKPSIKWRRLTKLKMFIHHLNWKAKMTVSWDMLKKRTEIVEQIFSTVNMRLLWPKNMEEQNIIFLSKNSLFRNTLTYTSTPYYLLASSVTAQYCDNMTMVDFSRKICEKQSTLCRFTSVLFSYRFIFNMQLCVILFRHLMHDNRVRKDNSSSTNTTHFGVAFEEQTLKSVLYVWASSYARDIFKGERKLRS